MQHLLELTNKEILKQAESEVSKTPYCLTEPLLHKQLKKVPFNYDPEAITAKIVLLDLLYATQCFRYKSLHLLPALVENIRTIPDFDERVASGDPSVVCEIYRGLDKKLFSFASKYCCLHNTVIYSRDDYSIFDSTVRRLLPKYAKSVGVKLSGTQLDQWYKKDNYEAFNTAVNAVLNAAEITLENRKRKFDLFLWSQR